MIDVKELQKRQAEIRDTQRDRIDQVHASLHEMWRDHVRHIHGAGFSITSNQARIEEMHNIIHAFMRGFDEAVIIHERIAEIEGRDPREVTKALWPVRTVK